MYTLSDKLMSVLSYLSFGMLGLVWLIIAKLRKKNINYYLYFNICQAIFLSILLTIISLFYDIAIGFMSELPFIGKFAQKFYIFFNQKVIFLDCSFSALLIFALLIYLSFFSLIVKVPKLPFITSIIQENFGR